jgi:hypothetical protein
MPPGPFDVDLDPGTRHELGARLRALLEVGRLDVRAMAAGLGVEPEVVVVALREVRGNQTGRLRSSVTQGRVTWWWEPAEVLPEPVPAAGQGERPSERRKGRGRHARRR